MVADTRLAKLVLLMLDEPDKAQREQLEIMVKAKAKQVIQRAEQGEF